MIQKINFKVKGILNKASQIAIEAEVETLSGVEGININSKTGSASLRFNEAEISKKEIFKKIEESGCMIKETENQNDKSKGNKAHMFIGFGVVIIVIIIFAVAFSSGGEKEENVADEVPIAQKTTNQVSENNDGFVGDKGIAVVSKSGEIFLDESSVNDGNLHAFNYFSEKEGKNIYFFVIKAPDGTYRVAANACEVCFGAKKGFSQVGEMIQCDNCRVTYPKSKIAKEKGGCNPGPITDKAPVKGGELVVQVEDVEAVAYLF